MIVYGRLGYLVARSVGCLTLGVFTASAVTVGPIVFSQSPLPPSIERHERVHCLQWLDAFTVGAIATSLASVLGAGWRSLLLLILVPVVLDWVAYFVLTLVYGVLHRYGLPANLYRMAGYGPVKVLAEAGYHHNPMEREARAYETEGVALLHRPPFGWLGHLRERGGSNGPS